MSLIMEPFIKANGLKKDFGMAGVSKFGRTAVSMRAIGKTIWPTEEVDSFILMAMSTKESGLMTRHMAEEPMFTWMELNIPVNGVKTNSMDSVSKLGLMALSMKEITNMARSMELEHSNGQMAQCTLGSSTTITFTARECIPGQMDVNTRVNGATTRCMVRVLSRGLTGASMSVSISMTRSRATVNLSGLMVAATRVIGKVANSTERASTLLAKVMKSTASGKTASV
jgi:hypothetical protein